MPRLDATILPATLLALVACAGDAVDGGDGLPVDPDAAEVQSIDRFSDAAGTLQVRDAMNGLPAANAPVDFDQPPFITRGLTPDGASVRYYNFDVMPTAPAPIYALFRSDGTAVEGQLNIVDVIPGEPGYNDFWLVTKVTVPDDYVANSATSLADLAGYEMEATDEIVNCPIVPAGSTATLGGGADGLHRGWFDGKVVHYFTFDERDLTGPTVPVSPIYVTFNVNPDEAGGGPASGFVTEEGGDQTHNVVATIPSDAAYSPLWLVSVYDNADFDRVSDLASIADATILAAGVATVNCPIVDL